MKLIMKKIDSLPLVYLLKGLAVLMFVLGLTTLITEGFIPFTFNIFSPGVFLLISGVVMSVLHIAQMLLVSPAILLALAKIITVMSVKNDKN